MEFKLTMIANSVIMKNNSTEENLTVRMELVKFNGFKFSDEIISRIDRIDEKNKLNLFDFNFILYAK